MVGFREWCNAHPKIVGVAGGALVLGAVVMAVASARLSGGPKPLDQGQVFFSADDGKSWFAESVTQPSPFMKDGKPAYRVFVWRNAKGDEFVSHMLRTASATQSLDNGRTSDPTSRKGPPPMSGGGVEVKRPGETAWTRADSNAGEVVAKPVSPDGNSAGLEPVEP